MTNWNNTCDDYIGGLSPGSPWKDIIMSSPASTCLVNQGTTLPSTTSMTPYRIELCPNP